MTLPVPLTVRLRTPRADRHLKSELQNLSYRKAVPGGNASARMSFSRPIHVLPDEIAYYSEVYIQDESTGNVVWDGRLDDPGRSTGASGEVWDLSAVGGSAHAHDRTLPHIFVDSSNEDWEVATDSIKACRVQGILSNDNPAVLLSVPEGTTWAQNTWGEVWYRRLVDTGQRLARLSYDWDCSATTTNNEINMVISPGISPAGEDTVAAAAFDTAGGLLTAVITTDWSAGTQHDVARCFSLRNGPTVAVTTQGELWFIPILRTVLYNKSGSERTAASNYTANTVKAEEIVEDLLGRILTQFDGANALVETSLYGINQLAYREAVDSWKIFADLLVFHPSNYWAAWERNPATGKYRFEWRQWPSTISYEAEAVFGFNAPGSAVELFNYVSIRYVGAQGRVRHRRRTQTVPLLDDAGLIREGYIDLKFDAGSEANAIQAGDGFLAEHAVPLSGATLTLVTPILDRDRGITIQPWEIYPGKLIRIRHLQGSQDALNATSRDGSTIFRVTAVEYDTSTGTARVELDYKPVTLAHLVASGKAPVIG